MTITSDEIYDRVRNLIPTAEDEDYYPLETLRFSVEAARVWHSRLTPKPALELGTGDATQTTWLLPDDVIRIKRLEKPYGKSPPQYMSSSDWEAHLGLDGPEIVFSSTPGSGDVFGIHYSGIWELEDMKNTDRSSLSYLTCAWICMRRAAAMSDTIDPIINADVINYGGQARAWIQLKDHFITLYAQGTGLSAKDVKDGKPPIAFGKMSTPMSRRFPRWWWYTARERS